MKNELHLTDFKGNELVVREGAASKPIEPIKVDIKGVINSPFNWLEKKLSALKVIDSNILIDKDKGTIILTVNEKSPVFDTIQGSLQLHPDFEMFNINSGESITSHDLAEKIKMFRSCFLDKDTAMKLVKNLRNFTAKVNKELEAFKDDRANYALKKSQIVETNLPESFTLVVPIFKGQEKRHVEVEININADNLNCTLISPEVNDYISTFKETIIDEQIDKIKTLVPDLAIIEV
jgi:hypothetical protein